ncbi:hypothetical protein B0H11DRAFT_542776 [Mycena galericulata]|nr:hypothetical protein B0H11DRAFT_542776 [Mycena galericulata]
MSDMYTMVSRRRHPGIYGGAGAGYNMMYFMLFVTHSRKLTTYAVGVFCGGLCAEYTRWVFLFVYYPLSLVPCTSLIICFPASVYFASPAHPGSKRYCLVSPVSQHIYRSGQATRTYRCGRLREIDLQLTSSFLKCNHFSYFASM